MAPRGIASLVLPTAVAVFLILSSYSVTRALHVYSLGLKQAAGTLGSRSWIDQRIGSGGNAAYLIGTTLEPSIESQVLWQNEFWNRSLRQVYGVNHSGLSLFSETLLRSEPNGSLVDPAGKQVRAPFVVTNLGFELDGRLIAAHPPLGLYRTQGPLHLAAATTGIYGDGWMSSYSSYSLYGRRSPPGKVLISLSRASWTGPDVPGHVRIVRQPAGSSRSSRAGRSTAERHGRFSFR